MDRYFLITYTGNTMNGTVTGNITYTTSHNEFFNKMKLEEDIINNHKGYNKPTITGICILFYSELSVEDYHNFIL